MKKISFLIITLVIIISLTACTVSGERKDDANGDKINPTKVSQSDNDNYPEQNQEDNTDVETGDSDISPDDETNQQKEGEIIPATPETNVLVFPVAINIGEEGTMDLNYDGVDDTIYYELDATDEFYYNVKSLKINDIEYVNIFEDSKLYMSFPKNDIFYIVDIDKSDGYREIAIMDEGPSDDPQTFFFRYDGNDLTYIGFVPDFPLTPTCSFDLDRSIIAKYRLDILQTWWAPATWKLDDQGILIQMPQEYYYPYTYNDETYKPELLQDLSLYLEPELNSEQIKVTKGSKVTFLATDNKNWVKIKAYDGTEGWFYMTNFMNILVEGEEIESTAIFNNLVFAD